jgi:hypothetical protein
MASELFIPMRVGVNGSYKWRVLDGDGVTPVLTDVIRRDGSVRRIHEGIVQPNLITNTGLDNLAAAQGYFLGRSALRIGTGSTEPAFTDTALANEVQTGTTAGTSLTWTIGVVGHDLVVTLPYARRITMNADRNLTEFGLATTTVAAVGVRELFRDEFGDPVTISLLNGKIIEVQHTLRIYAPRAGMLHTVTKRELDATNTVTSTTDYDVECGFANTGPVQTGNTPVANVTAAIFGSIASQSFNANVRTSSFTLPTTASAISSNNSFTNVGYTSGTFYRDFMYTFLTSEFNQVWYGCGFQVSTSGTDNRGDRVVRFVDPATFTKLSTHTFAIRTRATWGRVSS